MDINKIEEQEVNENTGQFIVVTGAVGAGKSTFASTFPKLLCLDLEGTAGNIKGLKRIKIERDGITKEKDMRDSAFLQLCDYAKQFLENDNFQTLILDGGLEFTKICQDYTLKGLGRKSMREHKFADTYQDSRDNQEKFIKKIIGNGKNLILITHIEEITEIDEDDNEYTIKRPLIGDKLMVYKIPALATIVGMVEIEKDGNRSFNCVGSDRNVLKNQYGITEKIPATYDTLFNKIKDFYNKK